MTLDFGTVICPECGGHGTTSDGGKDCPRCRGAGEVLACTECGGEGEFADTDDASGQPTTEQCEHCDGTGAEPPPPPQD